jgi:hypothetical protein
MHVDVRRNRAKPRNKGEVENSGHAGAAMVGRMLREV